MKQTRRDPHEGLKAQIYQKLNKFAKEFGFDELPLLVKNSCWDRKKGQFKLIGDKAFLAQINNAVEERREQLERKREEQAAQRGRVIISQAKPAPEEKMGEKGGGAAAPTARPARAELPRSEPERTEDSALPAGEPVAPLIEEKREGIPAPPVKRRRRSKVLPPTSKEEVVRSLKEFVRFFGFEQLPESVKQLVDSERNLRLPDDEASLRALLRDIHMRGWELEAGRTKSGAKRGRGKRGRRGKELPADIEEIIKDRGRMTLKELAEKYGYPSTSAVNNVLMAAEKQGYEVNAPEMRGGQRKGEEKQERNSAAAPAKGARGGRRAQGTHRIKFGVIEAAAPNGREQSGELSPEERYARYWAVRLIEDMRKHGRLENMPEERRARYEMTVEEGVRSTRVRKPTNEEVLEWLASQPTA